MTTRAFVSPVTGFSPAALSALWAARQIKPKKITTRGVGGAAPGSLRIPHSEFRTQMILLERALALRQILAARAHGLWTYEPRQGRKAATVVCSATAVVTLAFKFGFASRVFTPHSAFRIPRSNE